MSKGKKSKFVLAKVPQIDAPNFSMNPCDFKNFLPVNELKIKRIYWIDGIKNEKVSGQHAHKDDENEIFIVVGGDATIVIDEGKGKRRKKVGRGDIMWVPKMIWHGFEKISDDFVLMALTTTNYDPDRKGYVEDYQEFKKLLKGKIK